MGSFSTIFDQDGEVRYAPAFFEPGESHSILQDLLASVDWSQEPIKMFGRLVMQPRLTCWMADPGVTYKYSHHLMSPKPWIRSVLEMKQRLEDAISHRFNGALLNFYRDGSDSMGWHRDNEKELGSRPVIASVSFGAERLFELRRYSSKSDLKKIKLGHGSVLVMSGTLQDFWEHRIPKTGKLSPVGPRVNVTFRTIC
jgi:alkylated DNA repair dioxygenase AlkB